MTMEITVHDLLPVCKPGQRWLSRGWTDTDTLEEDERLPRYRVIQLNRMIEICILALIIDSSSEGV